jgi:hypothetical protein
VRPLAVAIVELRLGGRTAIAAVGAGLAIAGVVEGTRNLLGAAVIAVVLGAIVHLRTRRAFGRILAAPPAPPARAIEPTRATVTRVLRRDLALLAVAALLMVLFGTFVELAGALLGGGLSWLAAARRVAAWERRTGRRLLRVVRDAWGRDDHGRWGDGLLDSRDYSADRRPLP